MVQIILFFVIVLLGIYVFKAFPFEKGNVKNLVIAAIFIILTAILKRLTIMIPLFGTESLKVGLEYIPLMLAGYFLAPSYAFLIGLASDLIGLILVPTGFPFLGFTLVMILVSVIPSLVKNYIEHYKQHLSQTFVSHLAEIVIVLMGIGAVIYLYFLKEIKISDTMHTLTMSAKLPLMMICIVLVIAFIVIIHILKSKISEHQAHEFSVWILCVTLTELVCTLCLTPLWLDIMYGIPYFVSLCIRVIKLCAVLPIEIFIGYSLIQLLNIILR